MSLWSAQRHALYDADHAGGFDEIAWDRAPEEGPFIACCLRRDRMLAAPGMALAGGSQS